MPEPISAESRPLPDNPRERFLLNFAQALHELDKCREQNISASLMVLFARMKTSDSECTYANADHTVFGDFRMHLGNVGQLLYQFISKSSPTQRLMVRELLDGCIAELNNKE